MPQHRFWTEDPSCIAGAFREHLPSETVRALHEAVRAHGQAGVPRICVGYIHPGMVASRRALTAISHMIADPEIAMDAWVCCIGGTGFWAATGRGMATSVLLMARATAPVHLAATMDDAVRWLEKRSLPTPSAEVRRAAVAFGRAPTGEWA